MKRLLIAATLVMLLMAGAYAQQPVAATANAELTITRQWDAAIGLNDKLASMIQRAKTAVEGGSFQPEMLDEITRVADKSGAASKDFIATAKQNISRLNPEEKKQLLAQIDELQTKGTQTTRQYRQLLAMLEVEGKTTKN